MPHLFPFAAARALASSSLAFAPVPAVNLGTRDLVGVCPGEKTAAMEQAIPGNLFGLARVQANDMAVEL